MHPEPTQQNLATNDFPHAGADSFGNDFAAGGESIVFTPRKKEPYWKRIGGGSLGLSVLIHVLFILIAFFLIKFAVEKKQEEVVDFLPGGGGGGKSNSAKLANKRKSVSMNAPKARIVSTSSTATVTLPDVPMVNQSTSMSGFAMPSAGGVGGGEGGLSGSGKGGLMGNGFGKGVGPGNGVGFVAMFGVKIQARRLAVVLDVSQSMHPYLPIVVREANKISGGCPVVLFFGCGVLPPKERSVSRIRAERAEKKEFEDFWRRCTAKGKQVVLDGAVPKKEIFDVLADRKDTFYYDREAGDFGKLGNTWLALTSNEVSNADAIYWFADFKDAVDEEQLKEVRDTLLKRKQKLYVHVSGDKPKSLAAVENLVVKPTGGEVLKIDLKPARK